MADVLVVDDEVLVCDLIARELTSRGHEVDCVTSLTGAEAALARRAFDAVICDVNLESSLGTILLEHERVRAAASVVLVMSGRAGLTTAMDAMHRGADDFLVKPFTMAVLVESLATALRKRERERAEAERKAELERLVAERTATLTETVAELHHAYDSTIEALEMIVSASSRSADLTRQLLTFARIQAVEPQKVDPKTALAGIARMLSRVVGEQYRIECEVAPEVWPLRLDPSQLDSALANLVINARDAMENGGAVSIEAGNETLPRHTAAAHDVEPGDFVVIAVRDTGAGIDPQTIEHIFEPFFTTKERGHGTGLGMSTVYGIATQNGGFVTVESEAGTGTTVRVHLPRFEGRPADEEARPVRARGGEQEARVALLVEDDPEVLEITSLLLRRIGFQVVATGEPKHALELMKDGLGSIDLVVTDVIMPEMNGHELVGALREIDPGLPALYTSGYPADAIGPQGILDADVHFLPKPFDQEKLASKINEALEDQ